MSSISISLQNIHKKLGPNQALSGVSAEFKAATLHGLIGPDGAGKTTLMRTLAGLLHPDSGSLEYFQDQRPLAFKDLRASLAYFPQQQSLYPDLSISEHLELFRDLYQVPEAFYLARRVELLKLTRLEEFQDRFAGKLSGGMYKKLGLMCTLIADPKVLLLDEPTNGVDPISRRELWELLYGLVEKGLLVIISTAYMDEAERCGLVHVLENGRMLASGEPREVLAREGAPSFEALFLRGRKP
jgi:ABC-2 type transport system ATP-binding protein